MILGLTNLGRRYIEELNKRNIVIDVSHTSEKTFWDTIYYSNKPVVASHSCVYAICEHCRNLKDDQIKKIAEKDGIIGICFASEFLNPKDTADVGDIIKHIKYIINLVGIDYVGLGSDFDGVSYENILRNLNGVRDIHKLIEGLYSEGFTEEEIDKVMGDNWIRFLKQNLI